jgi:hypothetical protein
MPGRYLAILLSTLIWVIGYMISLYYFRHRFVLRAQPGGEEAYQDTPSIRNFLIGLIVLAPFLSGAAFRIGDFLEGGGIIWGCYFEDYGLITLGLWSLSFIGLSFLWVVTLISPSFLGFHNRKSALLIYLAHNLYTLILFLIIYYGIRHFSGDLGGKDGSCL